MPTGKINTFGNHTLPDVVIAKIRTSRPVSFASAFEEPVTATNAGGYLKQACERLATYIPEIEHAYGVKDDTDTWLVCVGPNTKALTSLPGAQVTLSELVTAVGSAVAQRMADR